MLRYWRSNISERRKTEVSKIKLMLILAVNWIELRNEQIRKAQLWPKKQLNGLKRALAALPKYVGSSPRIHMAAHNHL